MRLEAPLFSRRQTRFASLCLFFPRHFIEHGIKFVSSNLRAPTVPASDSYLVSLPNLHLTITFFFLLPQLALLFNARRRGDAQCAKRFKCTHTSGFHVC
jgi:hypothetical protein